MSQSKLEHTHQSSLSFNDRVCAKCMGHRSLCGVKPCPLLMRAKSLVNLDTSLRGLDLIGSSPPSVFVGSYGYPKVLMGPLVPPVRGRETELMERPDLWLTKSLDQILSIRFKLVRTKSRIPVREPVDPSRLLHDTQTLALSEKPTDSDATLLKRPKFTSVFSDRTLPIGPSAPLEKFRLEDNPSVPRKVDKVTSDTDFKAAPGIVELFDEGIKQEHITRLLSVGLLGQRKARKLVPTEWSITAIDDIVGKELHKRVLRLPWINDYYVLGDYALGNTVVLLFMPRAWQFEALECWLYGKNSNVISDHEFSKGRTTYAKNVVGAYYATRLPSLEYLTSIRRQAGVIVFMEINPQKWVPLGVWRFREIARRALTRKPRRYSTLEEAISEVSNYLRNPIENYLNSSVLYKEVKSQTILPDFFT
ncbi:MAG: hypothetical protein GF411_16215 [Candidatus Lokiarchaeota archaeon]|nr:hypothetical protein [Candidatus Lokiarchaeota archaeon]